MKNQTYIFSVVLSFLMLTLFTSESFSQTKRERMQAGRRVEQTVNDLKTKLELTDKQVTKLREIVKTNTEMMQKDMEDNFDDRDAMMQSRRTRMAEMDKQIETLLTKEQKVKYEGYKKERMERFQQGRRNFENR